MNSTLSNQGGTISSRLNAGYRVHLAIRMAPEGFVAGDWNAAQESQLRSQTQTLCNTLKGKISAGHDDGHAIILDLAWEYNNASYSDSFENSKNGGFEPAQWKQMWIASKSVWKSNFPKMRFAFNSLINFPGHGEWPGLQYNDIFPGANHVDFLGADMYSKSPSAGSNPQGWYDGDASSDKGSQYFAQPASAAEWMNMARNKGTGLWCGEGGPNYEHSGDAARSRQLILRGFHRFAREGRFAEYNEFHGAGSVQSGDHRWVSCTAGGVGTAMPGRPNLYSTMKKILQDRDEAAFDDTFTIEPPAPGITPEAAKTRANYSFFNGLGANGSPIWTTTGIGQPIYHDANGIGAHFHCGWITSLNKFVATYAHETDRVAVAQNPSLFNISGWSLLGYLNTLPDPVGTLYGISMPNRWISGTTLWFAYSSDPEDNLRITSASLLPLQTGGENNYPNGYAARFRIVIPRSAQPEAMTGFVFLFDQTRNDFKSVANGGLVESTQGHDIRFETSSGTKLAHDLEKYNAATGEVVAWFRLPSVPATGDIVAFCYVGRGGLSATEADPTACWQDYLGVWHLPTLADAGKRGRTLVSVGTVNTDSTTMIGNALSLAGTGLLRLDDVAFLDGLTNFTIQLRFKVA